MIFLQASKSWQANTTCFSNRSGRTQNSDTHASRLDGPPWRSNLPNRIDQNHFIATVITLIFYQGMFLIPIIVGVLRACVSRLITHSVREARALSMSSRWKHSTSLSQICNNRRVPARRNQSGDLARVISQLVFSRKFTVPLIWKHPPPPVTAFVWWTRTSH